MAEDWHLRKDVSAGTILTLVAMLVSGVIALTSVRADIAVVKNRQDEQVNPADVARIEERQKALKEDVKEIKKKVERLPAIEAAIKQLLEEMERINHKDEYQ